MTDKLYFEILPDEQKQVLETISKQKWINSYYLAGGTGLALQIGHRQSIDFDFFTKNDINNRLTIEKLKDIGKFELFNEAENTVNGSLNNIKVSFLKYKYPLLNTPLTYNQLPIADKLDIALMKLEAISGRGSKKDFIDIYFLLNFFTLNEILQKYEFKYGIEIANNYHLLKSLVYFEDARLQLMPKMLKKVNWDNIKKSIIKEVKKING